MEGIHVRLAPGTQVVIAPRGKTGVVREVRETVDGPEYAVMFPDGSSGAYRRDELEIRKQVQEAATGPVRDPAELFSSLIPSALVYRCVIGSQAYGLATDSSDVDTRGVFVAPPSLMWSLQGAPGHLEVGDNAEVYWELSRFCTLGLKANPNILECLHSPLVVDVSPVGEELLALRSAFLSKLVHQTYSGYVLSQFKKIERDFRLTGEPKWKHVMHLLRLLLSGTALVQTGALDISVGDMRDRLLAVRNGDVAWDDVEAWRLSLHASFDAAFASSPLPELPDYRRVEDFIIDVRRQDVLRGDTA